MQNEAFIEGRKEKKKKKKTCLCSFFLSLIKKQNKTFKPNIKGVQ